MDMYISIASKMLVGSIGLFTLIRIMGKKAMSELTPFDLLYVLILGALVEEALYDDKVNIFHIIFALTLWGVIVYTIEKILEKTEKISTVFKGTPSILIEEGKLNLQELKANHFDMEQLRSMLRQNNCYSIHDVYYAILEVNGGLTVITKDQMEIPTFLLIEEGKIKPNILKSLDKDEEWLRKELRNEGYETFENIIYCEWNVKEEKLFTDTYDNIIDEKIHMDN